MGDKYLAVTKFARPDGRVLELWLEKSELGRMWTEEITARFAKHEEARAKAAQAGADVLALFDHAMGKRISFGELGQGYIGFAAGGPRGIGLRAVVTMPGLRRDFALTIHPAENDEGELLPEEAAWRDRVQTNYFSLLKAGIEKVASEAAKRNLVAEEIAWDEDWPVNASAPATQTKPKRGLLTPQSSPSETKVGSSVSEPSSKLGGNAWLTLLALASLAVIAWFLLRGSGK
jgi:hypothetical protein